MRAAAVWFFVGFLTAAEIIGVLVLDLERRRRARQVPPLVVDLLDVDGSVIESRVVESHSGVGAWN
jgi:hypothetical protein